MQVVLELRDILVSKGDVSVYPYENIYRRASEDMSGYHFPHASHAVLVELMIGHHDVLMTLETVQHL